uniref:(California timema) hypothetical protein n=1 Tax=Timema californicum TaxID=61474 RepID=A0A7R9PCL1_TIMCA|nr:unnamed protein product [Timema californicum]
MAGDGMAQLLEQTSIFTLAWSASTAANLPSRTLPLAEDVALLCVSGAQHGDIDRVEKLLSKGIPVDTRDSAGYTALHYAARAGHTGMCERLISVGAGVNATTRSGSATPLHRAAAAGRLQVVKLLLRSGADASSIDADGKNALHRAVSGGHIEVAEALSKVEPALKDIVDKRGNLPLHYAGSNMELVELLK